MRALLTALLTALLAAGCGGGTDGTPAVPTTTPAPAPPAPPPPAPPPPAPTLRAVAQILSEPSSQEVYHAGEEIMVLVDLAPRDIVTVEGYPRLRIQIGEQVRLADLLRWSDWPLPRRGQRFLYEVGFDDLDADGISIEADAIDFSEGAFVNEAGEEVEVEIRAVTPKHVTEDPTEFEPGEPVDTHRVLGRPPPRVCTDERQRALRRDTNPTLLYEWDGTPFQFYFDAGIPESERADAGYFFGVAERLSVRIEEQLGYSVLEVGGWIPEDERGFRIGTKDVEDCRGMRGGIVATVIPFEGGYAAARPHCGVLYWTDNDIRTDSDGTLSHLIFHMFGFGHSFHPHDGEHGGVPMSDRLTNSGWSPRDLGVTVEDVETLRCILPEGG